MAFEKRRPPTRDRRRFQDVISASSSDTRKNNHSPYVPQGRRLLRQLGPGERAAIRAYRRCWPHLRVIAGGGP